MQWLIANMWMALAAATALGLLFGFSMRGLFSSSSVRKARVEREIAKTELEQSKAEVEALYSAQRKLKEQVEQPAGDSDALQTQLEEREARIGSLDDELQAARAELEAFKSQETNESSALQSIGAAAAGAAAGAVLSEQDDDELTRLRDRNTWLEERVTALEGDIEGMSTVPETASSHQAQGSDEGANVEKLKWQSTYLRQRVEALEGKIVSSSDDNSSSTSTDTEPAAPVITAAVDRSAEGARDNDEELAKLRWRNRYLEGRLAYFEQPSEEPTSTEEPEADETLETEPVATTEPDETGDSEPEAEAESVHPSEAMLAELDGEQPEQISKPSDGGDDLTKITGIGPRIAEVLNGLGIWRFSQIADWLPEHETWIENHLSFKGRVSRENWISQAKELMAIA